MMSLGVKAQTVHIGLDNGNLMNAVVPGNDSGWEPGFSTLWRHEQLALSMMGSDRDGIIEESGLINYPSAVFGKHSKISGQADDYGITIVGGRRPSFIVVSLPKGYRITSYTIVLSNDLRGKGAQLGGGNFNNINTNYEAGSSNGYGTMRFCEVKQWRTDGTNSGTNPRPDDQSNSDGYNLNRCRYIEPGLGWENDGQIGSEVIEWAREVGNQNNYDIKTNEYNPNDPNAVPKEYTLSRTAVNHGTADNPNYDMGNNLYFRLVKDYCYYGITIKEFRITFTAEGTFKAEIAPGAAGAATSAVGAPFTTSKIDIGKMSERSKPNSNTTHYGFQTETITNLVAYNWLYQDDAYENGIPADVATAKNIRPVNVTVNGQNQLLYALKSDTYYIETPIEIANKSGNTAPVGYRIVGAQFTPLWGNTSTREIPGGDYHYITYTSGEKTYYLNSDGRFVITDEPTRWTSDNNGIHVGDVYLVCSVSGQNKTLSASQLANQTQISDAKRIRRDNSNRLYYTETITNDNNTTTTTTYYVHGTAQASVKPTMETGTTDLAVWTTRSDATRTITDFSPGPYKLRIWKRDGSGYMDLTDDPEAEDKTCIEITGGSNDPYVGKVIDLGLLNNDAIKFEIEMTGNDAASQALVKIDLFLQTLDPYIDKMDIVCTDSRKVLKLTQSFTADDFSVSGGKFVFYVPSDYANEMLTFTFSDLYSKYGDGTYYDGGDGTGRYSFVTSEYFLDRIDGNGNDGLYDDDYDSSHPYNGYPVTVNGVETGRRLSKIETSTAGNIRFKFNNAEDLTEGGSQVEGAELEEYPFSVAIYKASTDPGDPLSATPHGANTSVKGNFDVVQLQASKQDQHSGTYFVFTADETRWNIAPTKNWQHRFYAFYRMEIDLVARTFTPKFTVTKIYDKTYQLYREPSRDENGNIIKENGNIVYENEASEVEKSMYGLTLDVADLDENNQPVQGYLTYQEIIDLTKKGRNDIYYTPAECESLNAILTGAITVNTELTAEQAAAVNRVLELTGNDQYTAGQKPSAGHAIAYNATLDGHVTTSDIKAHAVAPILKDEAHASEGPTSLKQILYVDGTPLYAMLNSSQSSVVKTLGDLKDELAENALVFLPENTTSTLDNVAYITSDKSSNSKFFQAGKDIVLTDKYSFFSPYRIQVDAANKATYAREVSGSTSTLVDKATVVLPFTLTLANGKHTNQTDDGFAFNVRTLKQLQGPTNNDYYSEYEGEGGFALFDGSKTVANQPYMVEVTDGVSDTYSFIASQYGAVIESTPTVADEIAKHKKSTVSEDLQKYDLDNDGDIDDDDVAKALADAIADNKGIGEANFISESEKGIPTGQEGVALTNYGSYSGAKIPKDYHIYYFNKKKFYCSSTLAPKYTHVNLRPFRAFYSSVDPSTFVDDYSTSSPAKMTSFIIVYDLFSNDGGITTSLTETSKPKVMTISTDKGSMLISANEDIQVKILSVNGVNVDAFQMNAGEQRQVNVPSGIYIVNNTKILVK